MQDLHVVENIPNDKVMEKVYLNDTKSAFAKQVQAEDVSARLGLRQWNDPIAKHY
jgi:hypothetical protein